MIKKNINSKTKKEVFQIFLKIFKPYTKVVNIFFLIIDKDIVNSN